MAGGTATHPSLIQGISQQAENARGTASCTYQENCLNEVLDGAVSRMGTVLRAGYSWSLSDPMVHEINRSAEERYLVLVEGGTLRVINRDTGALCALTGSIASYLSHTGSARKSFRAVTVGDTTFLLNREVVVKMGTAKSPVRPNMGSMYFRAGGYKVTYTVTVKIGSDTYTTSYETPDNSAAGNAEYITTDHLAEQFRLAFVGTIIPDMVADGHTGFSIQRFGSTLVLEGPTSKPFTLVTTDGVGDTYLKSCVDTIESIADLPKRSKVGYVVSVAPPGGSEASWYWLKYEGTADSGRWVEVVAPDTVLGLDASTMPHLLVNTGPDSFEVKQSAWGQRVSGDGQRTSPNPSFVDYPIRDLQFLSGRLAAVTEYTSILSRARNAFVWFPDTAQTTLDSAPIDYDVSNGSATSIEYAVAVAGRLQFWGLAQQTYLDSGQDALKESTTEVLPLANYEFDGEVSPHPVGLAGLLFSTAVGAWSRMTELLIQRSTVQGEIVISDHVPKLLAGSVRTIAPGEAARKTFVLTSGTPTTAYLYQWYNQGQERVQSAWNPWTFPATVSILWAGVRGGEATFLFNWGTHTTLEVCRLDSIGDEPTQKLSLRLDHRVDESKGVFSGDHWLVTLPFPVEASRQPLFKCYERTDSPEDNLQRGREVPIRWASTTTIEVLSDNPDLEFFVGVIPVARRVASRFFARDRQDQPIIHDRLLIRRVAASHERTAQYDIVVRSWGEEEKVHTYVGRALGDPETVNDDVPIKTGSHEADVGDEAEVVEIELRNPTPYPCIWTAMRYDYELTVRQG